MRQWEEKPLDWAMERIAQLVKETRDETWRRAERTGQRRQPHRRHRLTRRRDARQRGELPHQEVFCRGLGMVWVENQARI